MTIASNLTLNLIIIIIIFNITFCPTFFYAVERLFQIKNQ